MNTDCKQNEARLLAFLLDELEPGERQAIVDHLSGCDNCKAELETLRQTVERLHREFETATDEPRLSEGRVAALKVGNIEEVRPGSDTSRRNPWIWGSWAALALFGLLGLTLLIPGEREPSEPGRQLARLESRAPEVEDSAPLISPRPAGETLKADPAGGRGESLLLRDQEAAKDEMTAASSDAAAMAEADAFSPPLPVATSGKELDKLDGADSDVGAEPDESPGMAASFDLADAAVQSGDGRVDVGEEYRTERRLASAPAPAEFEANELSQARTLAGAGGDSSPSREALAERAAAEPAELASAFSPAAPQPRASEEQAASSGELRKLGYIAGEPSPLPRPSLPNDAKVDAMFFQNYGVNPFIDTEEDPQSTFAADVDTASFTIVRGYLDRGIQPPPDAVRVEEFVNYFQADYPAPVSQAFAVYSEAAPSPFREGYTLLKIGIKGREVSPSDRRPVVLTFVVDVSGSMAREDRLGLVKRTLGMLLRELRPGDRVGLAVYGSEAREILSHVDVTDEGAIENGIARLVSGGSTNAEEGLRVGYSMARRAFDPDAVNRVVLCSDGVANVGRTGADSILEVIGREANDRIYLTALGFGLGNYNDVLLEQLANRGNGHYAYLDTDAEALKFVRERLADSMEVIAQDVKIQVEMNPAQVLKYRLLGYENRDIPDRDFRNDRVDAGEIGSGHAVTALYEIKLRDEGARDEIGVVRIRFKDPARNLKTTEIEGALDGEPLRERFHDADSHFHVVWIAAQFAEILRGSYWARDLRVADLIQLLGPLSDQPELSVDRDELLHLLRRAEAVLPEGGMNSSLREVEVGDRTGTSASSQDLAPGQLEMTETQSTPGI